jgi:flagellar basal-body rod protein FlgC
MDISSLFDISAAGMNVERMRLEVSAANLANANTTRGPNGIPYVPQQVVVQSGAARFDLPALPEARVEASPVAPRLVYDPAHPDANADGFVSYPGVDPVSEMVQLMTVTRAYEADVRAFNAARSMAQRALDIGSSR